MYQRMNPILQNEALVFPQQLVIDANVVTNHSGQIEVSFKLGIDSRVHYHWGCQVCEILFELLEDNGLISCVSLGKWDGKEEYRQDLEHVVDL